MKRFGSQPSKTHRRNKYGPLNLKLPDISMLAYKYVTTLYQPLHRNFDIPNTQDIRYNDTFFESTSRIMHYHPLPSVSYPKHLELSFTENRSLHTHTNYIQERA